MRVGAGAGGRERSERRDGSAAGGEKTFGRAAGADFVAAGAGFAAAGVLFPVRLNICAKVPGLAC